MKAALVGIGKIALDQHIRAIDTLLQSRGEYLRLHADMGRVVAHGGGDVDLRQMTLVADAFTPGRRKIVVAFCEDA